MARPKGHSNHPLYGYFNDMRQRGRRVGCDLGRGPNEFYRWLSIIGLPPEGMIRPTVGRYDHSKGYVWDQENNRWNFRWQSFFENNSEMGSNRGAFKTGVAIRRAIELGVTGFQSLSSEQQSELGRRSNNSPNSINKRSFICPWCGNSGIGSGFKRAHFDNCWLLEIFSENNSSIEGRVSI